MKSPKTLLAKVDWNVVHEGDVVILRADYSSIESQNALESIRDSFELLSREKNILFLIIPPAYDISVLPEEDMNHLGWYRHVA